MTSSLSVISEIKKKICDGPYVYQAETRLYNHEFGNDERFRLIYLSADVYPDCLNKGKSSSYEACQYARTNGVAGDSVGQIIGRQLGGIKDPSNVFPWNKKVDISAWKADEKEVYNHVKNGKNAHAHLMYGIQYNEDEEAEPRRLSEIHYCFQLFENSNTLVRTIEGHFKNTSPRVTNENFYYKGSPFVRCD
ncbi:hypothetical protein M3Y97_00424800 [Aphelenchoides bicaudatus]|nr:hypothetical protein M3Y97_00424800 [Aphelenchoides bicaudatus]